LRGEGADKAIAGAGRVHSLHGAAGIIECLAGDKREHAALAQRDADDSFVPVWQAPRRFDEASRRRRYREARYAQETPTRSH
jgi:hypothetical protein